MKWPVELALIRHGESEFNALKASKRTSGLYDEFCDHFKREWDSPRTRDLALRVQKEFSLDFGDYDTPLTTKGTEQAGQTASRLSQTVGLPDAVFVSPYLRTCQTFSAMKVPWPDLGRAKILFDDRIREQEHGLSLLYNDWRVMHVLHPAQHHLWERQGRYWYQFPQGESVSQVRDRARSWMTTLIREFAGKRVLAITHHLTILSLRANLERLSPEQFIRLDEEETPINCGVTVYRGNFDLGSDGRLQLALYNQQLY